MDIFPTGSVSLTLQHGEQHTQLNDVYINTFNPICHKSQLSDCFWDHSTHNDFTLHVLNYPGKILHYPAELAAANQLINQFSVR